MTLYENAKKFGKRYLVPILVAGALYLGGGASQPTELPINPSSQTIIQENVLKEQKGYISKARQMFTSSIEDGVLTIEEQEQIYASLKQAVNLNPALRDKSLITNGDYNLRNLLQENLYGYDAGKPNLELVLNKNGINVAVEPKGSGLEYLVLTILTSSAVVAASLGILKQVDKFLIRYWPNVYKQYKP